MKYIVGGCQHRINKDVEIQRHCELNELYIKGWIEKILRILFSHCVSRFHIWSSGTTNVATYIDRSKLRNTEAVEKPVSLAAFCMISIACSFDCEASSFVSACPILEMSSDGSFGKIGVHLWVFDMDISHLKRVSPRRFNY